MVTQKEWTRNTPWRQGHLLPNEAVKSLELIHPKYPDETLVIIASHDCDLTQLPDKEPHIEVIVGRQIQSMNGNYTHAKSSRTLNIGFEGKETILAEFISAEKHTIQKKSLLDFSPEPNVIFSPANKTIFQLWLASRYRRSAFPDEFENRLKEGKLHEKIVKAVKPHGEMITAIFFDIDEGRDIAHTGPDDVYVLDIILLHSTEPDFYTALTATNKAKNAIEHAFKSKLLNSQSGSWKNIELRYVDVISEEVMTYKNSKELRKWALDHISLGADPQQQILTE